MNRLLFFSCAIFFASCQQFSGPASDPDIVPASKPASSLVADSNSVLQVGDSNIRLQDVHTINAEQAAAMMPSAGLNPPHGQPGHDCAIAVGAPLTSKPVTAVPQNNATSAPIAIPAPQDVPNTSINSGAKLNPPHGQPGHDCAIAVGAPLKT